MRGMTLCIALTLCPWCAIACRRQGGHTLEMSNLEEPVGISHDGAISYAGSSHFVDHQNCQCEYYHILAVKDLEFIDLDPQ